MGVFLASAVGSIPHTNLNHREVRVLVEYAKYCNDESGTRKNGKKFVVGGDCHPSQSDVAYNLHMYRTNVNADVKKLVKVGWLIPDGKYKRYKQYKFNMSMLVNCIDSVATLQDIKENTGLEIEEFLQWQKSFMDKARAIPRDDSYGDRWFPGYEGRIFYWEEKDDEITVRPWILYNHSDSQEAESNDGCHTTAPVPGNGCACNCNENNTSTMN